MIKKTSKIVVRKVDGVRQTVLINTYWFLFIPIYTQEIVTEAQHVNH